MKQITGKVFVIILLSFLLVFNPLIAASLYAVSSERFLNSRDFNSPTLKNRLINRELALMMDDILAGNYYDLTGVISAQEEEPFQGTLPSSGAMDPFLDKAGKYFSGFFEDEEFDNIVGGIFEEILNDERIAGFDIDALMIEILRDERLAQILGQNIADYLRDDDLIELIIWFTEEIERLLKDEKFIFFIRNAIKDFLGDERIIYILQDIVAILIKVPEDIIQRLSDDDRFGKILADILDLVLEPVSAMAGDLIKDPRVTRALDNILEKLESIPEELLDNLMSDVEFTDALENLQESFKKPLLELVETFLETATEEQVINSFVEQIMDLLESEESYIHFMDILKDIKSELDAMLTAIGEEVDLVIDYYGAREGSNDDDDPDDPLAGLIDEGDIETHVEGMLNHWIEILIGLMDDFEEDLAAAVDPYLGDDSLYIEWIIEAATENVESSIEVFIEELKIVLDYHIETDYVETIGAILAKYETDERIDLIIDDALQNASFESLIAIIEDQEEVFLEVLDEIIANLPLDKVYSSSREEEELANILDDIILEIPYDAIADLLTEEEIDKILEGFVNIINELPFDGIVSLLVDNADDIGFSTASVILNDIADGIEFPSPPDPHRSAIVESLRSEDRMRRFYIDLGADPETLTPESTAASVIIGIILDIIEKDNRMERFLAETERRAEPVNEELIDYGEKFSGGIKYYLGRVFNPTQRFFDPIRRLFYYERSDLERIGSLLQKSGLGGFFKWAGGLSTEVLKESDAATFLGGSIADFLLSYGIVEELATFDRFSVINSFLAEEPASEELKIYDAHRFAENLMIDLEEGVSGIRSVADSVSPSEIASTLTETISGAIPAPISLSIEDAGLETEDIVYEATNVLIEEIPGVRQLIDDLVVPSMGIPFDFLSDKRTQQGLEEVFQGTAEPVVDILADVLQDPRLNAILRDIFEEVIVILPQLTSDLTWVIEDERTLNALEDLIVNITTDRKMLWSVGDLLGQLLSDEELLNVLEDLLYTSVFEVIYGHDGYPFETAYVKVMGTGLIPVEIEQMETSSYNGLFYFVEVLMEWLRCESPELSPSEFLRQYPLDYLSEERIRPLIAEPLAFLTLTMLSDIVKDDNLHHLVYNSIESLLDKDLLGAMGNFLQYDSRFSYILSRFLANFPFEGIADTLQGSGLKELAGETLVNIPLEELIPFVYGDRNIRGIISDFRVNIDPSPLRAILPIDAGIPEIVTERVSNFPAGILTNFFLEDDRAYRMGYTIADIESRFSVNLFEKTELAEFQRDIILEKLAEADYGLIEDIFNGLSKITRNELLADFLGEFSGDILDDIYLLLKQMITSMASILVRTIKNTFTGLLPFFLMFPLLQTSNRSRYKGGDKE